LQATLTIAFAHAPDRGRILFDFLSKQDDSLLYMVSIQQDLCTTGDFQRGLAVAQQFLQGNLIFPSQFELVRLATAHISSLRSGRDR